MKSPKMPPPPDPVATANAQSAGNIATATATQGMNMVDQHTPEGSLTYQQVGTMQVPNGFGGTMAVPRYSATQSLSPEQQKLYDLGMMTEQNIASIGHAQSGRIGELLGTPINLNNEATEARLMELGSKRLDPKFAQQEEGLRTRLANSGIRQGSAAWDTEMRGFSEGKNDAYNQLLLTGRAQSVQEALAERNQPINEITALLSGSQVSQPNFVNTPNTNVAGVDYAGLVSNNYNAQLEGWKQKTANQNAMMGGLFGLGSNLATMGMRKFG